MAKVQNNLVMKGVTGQLGDQLVMRNLYGETIMSVKGVRTGEPSAAQLAQQERFRQRQAWAAAHKDDPEYVAASQANRRRYPGGYQAALSDALTDPDFAGGKRYIDDAEVPPSTEFNNGDNIVLGLYPVSLTVQRIDVRVYEYASDPSLGGVTPTLTHATDEAAVLAAPPDGIGNDIWQFDLGAFLTGNAITIGAENWVGLGITIVDKYGNETVIDPHTEAAITTFGDALAYLEAKLA